MTQVYGYWRPYTWVPSTPLYKLSPFAPIYLPFSFFPTSDQNHIAAFEKSQAISLRAFYLVRTTCYHYSMERIVPI